MQEQVTTNKSELWSLSLRDLFYKYVRFLPFIVLSVAIALLIAYVYLRYATPIYQVGSTMVIKAETQSSRGSGDKFDDLFSGGRGQNVQSEIEILKSKPLMARVVRALDLQFIYQIKGKIKTLEIYKHAPFRIEASSLADSNASFVLDIEFEGNDKFRVNDEPAFYRFNQYFKNGYGTFRLVRNPWGNLGKEYSITYQPVYALAVTLANSVQVSPKTPGSGILNLSMQTPNSFKGADVLNKLMEEYGVYTKEVKRLATDSMLLFIDERLGALKGELDSVQKLLLDYSLRNNIVDIESQQGFYFDNISLIDEEINKQQLQMMSLDILGQYLRSRDNQYLKVPTSFALEDATLATLIGGYNQLQLERQQLLDANVPASNPAVLQKESEIEKVRTSVIENIQNLRSATSRVIGRLQAQSNSSQSQLKSLPFKAKGYYELRQQVTNKETLYNLLQAKREETAISKASTVSNSQIVEVAVPTSTPIKPKKRSIQVLAALIGLAIPFLFIFLGEILNDKISTRFDIEKITDTPIVGEVGHSYADKTLVVNKTTRSMVAEQFRIIRSNLQYISNKDQKQVILITSSFSGEGKSYVSTNMGAVLALAGKKTVVLEFDIRKPKLLSGLGIAKRPGLTNFIVGKTDNIDELIIPVPGNENLFVIACGPVPPNPSELLLESRVNLLFEELKKRFDVVVIDTAPVGMVSDAMTLGKFADCTLYLVRQGHTFKKQVILIDEFYRDNKLPKVSIIINDVKMKPGYGYYGYGRYGYGYGYGYGSYYEEEHPPRTFIDRAIGWFDLRTWFKKKRR